VLHDTSPNVAGVQTWLVIAIKIGSFGVVACGADDRIPIMAARLALRINEEQQS
jgi:hypothetical protein